MPRRAKRNPLPVNGTQPRIGLDEVMRKTCENVCVLVIKVHNMNVEVQAMRKENAQLLESLGKLAGCIAALFDSTEARNHAEAMLRDFVFNKNNPR